MDIRVGYGFDVHKLVKDRALWLGGLKIDYEKGLLGHSDADVLIHSICDALLGAANMRDIGYQFPDKDDRFKDIDSKILLKNTIELIGQKKWKVSNIDVTLCAEEPKINKYIPKIVDILSSVMNISSDAVSVKATTSESLGFTGRGEGMSCSCVALISR